MKNVVVWSAPTTTVQTMTPWWFERSIYSNIHGKLWHQLFLLPLAGLNTGSCATISNNYKYIDDVLIHPPQRLFVPKGPAASRSAGQNWTCPLLVETGGTSLQKLPVWQPSIFGCRIPFRTLTKPWWELPSRKSAYCRLHRDQKGFGGWTVSGWWP